MKTCDFVHSFLLGPRHSLSNDFHKFSRVTSKFSVFQLFFPINQQSEEANLVRATSYQKQNKTIAYVNVLSLIILNLIDSICQFFEIIVNKLMVVFPQNSIAVEWLFKKCKKVSDTHFCYVDLVKLVMDESLYP